MKPLRDLVLVKLEQAVKEEKTKSGIILLSTTNDRYQFDDDESKLQDIIGKAKQNKGTVIAVGRFVDAYNAGDEIIYRKGREQSYHDIDGELHAMVRECDVLVTLKDKRVIPNPNYVLVRISKEAREALFNKRIKRDDGTDALIFIAADKGQDDESSSQFFVSTGEVLNVGKNIKTVAENDTALLDYLCDNDNSIIVGYEGEDKIIAVSAVTTRHKETNIVYANRREDEKGNRVCKRDQIVWEKGDIDEMSALLGTIRNGDIIAIEPYVFLEHKETKVMKVGKHGMLYEEDEKIIERQVVGISAESKEMLNIDLGKVVLIDDFDSFSTKVGDTKISCVNDSDIHLSR